MINIKTLYLEQASGTNVTNTALLASSLANTADNVQCPGGSQSATQDQYNQSARRSVDRTGKGTRTRCFRRQVQMEKYVLPFARNP